MKLFEKEARELVDNADPLTIAEVRQALAAAHRHGWEEGRDASAERLAVANMPGMADYIRALEYKEPKP